MIDFPLLGSIALIHLVALASPGPDFAMILKVSRQQQRSVALLTALGIALAILLHTIASITGLSLLIHTTAWLFVLVQTAGATYLCYMGIGTLRSLKHQLRSTGPDPRATADTRTARLTGQQGLRLGLYTNLLNPKALMFFLTLFSALVGPEVNTATRIGLIGMIFILSFAWFGTLALLLTRTRVQQTLVRLGPWIDLLTGMLFLSVSIAILASLAREWL